MSAVPKEGVDYPHYYADLVLSGSYADGQSAGETRSTIHLSQASVESKQDGVVEQISLAESDQPSKYIVDMRFANVGNIHLEPHARLFLSYRTRRPVRNIMLSAEEGSLLPLGKRSFSGELDFAGVEPGYYAMRARVGAADNIAFTGQEIVMVKRRN